MAAPELTGGPGWALARERVAARATSRAREVIWFRLLFRPRADHFLDHLFDGILHGVSHGFFDLLGVQLNLCVRADDFFYGHFYDLSYRRQLLGDGFGDPLRYLCSGLGLLPCHLLRGSFGQRPIIL